MSNKQPLKYLFSAYLKDGYVYHQTEEDVSRLNSLRSCFYDLVQEEEKGNKVLRFVLKGEGYEYAVDLQDGHFEIDGVPFAFHEPIKEVILDKPGQYNLVILKDFRLVFFREHNVQIEQSVEEGIQPKILGDDIVYRMGWQCTLDGKNYQQIMRFA